MKLKSELNKDSILSFYYENREFILPIFAIIVSVLLFIIFIIPQVISFPARKSEVDIEVEKLNKIKESEKVLSNSNADLINSQVEIALKTLPDKKSFESILSVISKAANLSNSLIESYVFEETPAPPTLVNFQSITFEISIFGGVTQATDFIDELYQSYPISNVTSIKNSENLSTIIMVFYYSPYISQKLDDRTLVRAISPKEKETLSQISEWIDASDYETPVSQATESAETRSSPF